MGWWLRHFLIGASCAGVLLALLTPLKPLRAQTGPYIAGTAPDKRPEGAPRIDAVEKAGHWYADALAGVTQPYPYSLRFLEDQGHWYSPFAQPGMTGPYDIRGWHSQPPKANGK